MFAIVTHFHPSLIFAGKAGAYPSWAPGDTPVIDWVEVGNCDIDFFIFRHWFWIARLKFTKFERDQNASEKCWSYIYENKN